jgi:hypothetical protein
VAVAWAAGLPYDPQRLDPLQRLHAELAGAPLVSPTDGPALPFFEAYFSNFIEGTEFAVEEAADIVFNCTSPGCVQRMLVTCSELEKWSLTRYFTRPGRCSVESLELAESGPILLFDIYPKGLRPNG